ncbi:MAG: alkylation response protein AidB-like acyl-CoA dehydrogenase [Myxococcota bacterium]|jgi:alkylation response protein AidB-like acyl-CoA dehydrogenase
MSQSNDTIESFRADARGWLDENFPKSLAGRGSELAGGEFVDANANADLKLWVERLGNKGWGTPTWPAEYGGGGLSQLEAEALKQEMASAKAFNPLIVMAGMGITMVGPTILEYGTEKQKQKHIPPICRADVFWALGYSEPNAGSDLASLACKAEDKGDHWLINGQKTWTSGADHAQWIGCLVRTNFEGPKRDGISFVILDMNQPGIETRPIQLIGGASPFCETFFNNAVADKDEILGELNAGWTVGKRLLQHERQSQTSASGGFGGNSRRTLPEIAETYVGRDEQGRIDDGDLRARLAEHMMKAKAQRLTVERITAEARGKAKVSAAASILKNAASSIAQERTELMLEMMGNSGIGWEGDGFEADELTAVRGWLGAKAISIYGGSYEIQNNIIAKHILGLPENTQKG